MKQGIFALAQCMRAHAVPNFPGPTFSAKGEIIRHSGTDPYSGSRQAAPRHYNPWNIPAPVSLPPKCRLIVTKLSFQAARVWEPTGWACRSSYRPLALLPSTGRLIP